MGAPDVFYMSWAPEALVGLPLGHSVIPCHWHETSRHAKLPAPAS